MQEDKPSRTAYKVALGVLALGAKPGMEKVLPPGVVDATAGLLEASGVVGPRAVRWSQTPGMVSVYEAFDWVLPGQFEAFAYRKAFCEHQVREGIGAGASQVLVLGAGYDTLGWRLAPEFPGVGFFEIDHPATARLKAKGIATMGPRDNLVLIAADLGKNKLEDVVAGNARWRRDARSVILAEGLVMYLAGDAVRDLFVQCARVGGGGSTIAFTYIPTGADGRLDAGRWTGPMLWLQSLAGEPWLWSVRPEALGSFLAETGWELRSDPGGDRRHGVEFYAVATKRA